MKSRSMLSLAVAGGLVLGAGSTAFAAPGPVANGVTPAVCTGIAQAVGPAPQAYTESYNTSQTDKYIGNSATRVYGQSGGTLSITSGTSTTTSGSLQTTATVDANAVFAGASLAVGVTIGLSKSVTTTIGYNWTVPSTQSTGWVEMGSHGYQISWNKGHYNAPCTWVQDGSGTVLGTTSNAQFAHS